MITEAEKDRVAAEVFGRAPEGGATEADFRDAGLTEASARKALRGLTSGAYRSFEEAAYFASTFAETCGSVDQTTVARVAESVRARRPARIVKSATVKEPHPATRLSSISEVCGPTGVELVRELESLVPGWLGKSGDEARRVAESVWQGQWETVRHIRSDDERRVETVRLMRMRVAEVRAGSTQPVEEPAGLGVSRSLTEADKDRRVSEIFAKAGL